MLPSEWEMITAGTAYRVVHLFCFALQLFGSVLTDRAIERLRQRSNGCGRL